MNTKTLESCDGSGMAVCTASFAMDRFQIILTAASDTRAQTPLLIYLNSKQHIISGVKRC